MEEQTIIRIRDIILLAAFVLMAFNLLLMTYNDVIWECGIDCPFEDIYPKPVAWVFYQINKIHKALYNTFDFHLYEDGSFEGCLPWRICN
jgi:hypothetical protein